MEYKNWVDLSEFGAQFKRLNLQNGTSIPVVIINDVAKFNSKALPLENFKDGAPDGVPFNKLPGNKKGRDFNQPILYMTKSFQAEGDSAYSILPSLSKLLNIDLEAVKLLRKRMPVDEVVSDIPYADLEKFSAISDSCFHAYAGNTLYAVKNPTAHTNLIDYAKSIQNQQHGLFPKANVANIPFDTLDKMGVTTSIIGRAFLNPKDAQKQGIDINDLTRIHLEGEMSILPISINDDLSINYISNVSDVSQLAYSNFKWRDNIGMINDYNALVAVQEASRLILNTRPSAIQTPAQMDGLIRNISVTLQNFNESNDVSKTHKAIKYFNKGITTHVIKNQQGEWRYIEKDGAKKFDAPLTWENYKKALTTIANYNTILSSALELEVKKGAEFDAALKTVFEKHQQFYKSTVQVVESVNDADLADRLIINTNGQKVHKNELAQEVNNFNRDMGKSLYSESVKQMLSGMRGIEDAGNIKNVVGAVVDEYTIQNTVRDVGQDLGEEDIGLSMLDKLAEGGAASLAREIKIGTMEVIETAAHGDYVELPRGISEAIDANYAQVNDIYKTLQHIELSKIPYYQGLYTAVLVEESELAAKLNSGINASFEDYLRDGDQVFAANGEKDSKALNDKLSALREISEQYNQILDHSRIQSNILRYQFEKTLGRPEQPTHSLLVLQSDIHGNYVPFTNATDCRIAEKLMQNAFTEQNINGFVERKTELTAKLDEFVLQHYAITSVDPAEPHRAIESIQDSIQELQVFADIEHTAPEPSPIADIEGNELNGDFVYRVNYALKSFADSKSPEALDTALAAIARQTQNMQQVTGIPFPPTNKPEYNELIKQFSEYDGSLDYPFPVAFVNPQNGVAIGDMTKVEILKAVADQSFSNLDDSNEINPALLAEYSMSVAEARLVARENIETSPSQELAQKMAGQFLLNYQSSFKVKELPHDEVYFYSVNGSVDSFKVKSAKFAELPLDVVVLSHSNTLNIAVREAFAAYQVHQIASDLGITGNTLKNLVAISNHIKNGDLAQVDALTQATFSQDLSADDLMSIRLIGPSDKKDALGNRLVLIEANDAGQLYLTHDQSQKLLDAVALTNKLAGIESSFRENPLIATIGNNAEFDRVQKYLLPDLEEHASLSVIIKAPAEIPEMIKDLADKVAAYSIDAYKNGLAEDILINLQDVTLATNLLSSEKDIVFSRVVPSDWNLPFVGRGMPDFNFTNIRNNDASLNKEMLAKQVLDHITHGSYSMTRPSAPVLAKANSYSLEKRQLSEAENNFLNNASGVIGGSQAEIHNFKMAYAANNLQVALNNLPEDLIKQIQDSMKGDIHPRDVSIRVSMSAQDKTSLPQIVFDSFNTSMPEDNRFLCRFDAADLTRIMNHGNFNPSDLGKKPVSLEMNSTALDFNEIFLSRRDFDLNEYMAHASEKLGVNIQIEDPLAGLDKVAPITFEERDLSVGLLKSNIAIMKGLLAAQGVEDPDLMLNHAKVFIKGGEPVTMAVAHSEAKCREYIADGFLAVSKQYSPHYQPSLGFNILREIQRTVRTPDDVENMNALVGRFFNVVDQPVKIQANEPLNVEIGEPVLIKSLKDLNPNDFDFDKIIEVAAETLTEQDRYVPPPRKTKFADKLYGFTFSQMEDMRAAEIATNVRLDKIWPQSSLETHINSGHQNLDTLLLTQALRNSITCQGPAFKEGSSLEKEALAYNFFLTEMHGAFSKSRTPEDLLGNFDKAYMNVVNLHPEFFSKTADNRELNNQNHAFNAFKEASFAFVNGTNASTALAQSLSGNLSFMSHYDDAALAVGEREQLYAAEKPFVNYMDGFTLNAQGNHLAWLNDRLESRLKGDRKSIVEDLGAYETTGTAVHRDILNVLQARTAIDFSPVENSVNLYQKWDINFTVADGDSHFAQGFGHIADGLLSKLQESLGNELTNAQVGRGLKIEAGAPYRLSDDSDLYITDVVAGVQGGYDTFANRYIYQMVKSIELTEQAKMSPAEISQFSAVKEEYRGLVAMVEKYGYEPKTHAARALIAIHDSLIGGNHKQDNQAHVLLEHSKFIVSSKNANVQMNAVRFSADHSGEYAKHYASYMEARQDAALKNLGEKMLKMQTLNPDAPDLYHFTPAVDMLDKISSTASITSKSAVDKFIEEQHGSKPKAAKDSIAASLNAALAEKPESIIDVQDYLASRAADKFINLLNQYAPDGLRGNQQFLDNVEKYFGTRLGENAQYSPALYSSEYGHNQEVEHRSEHSFDPENTPAEINADRVVYNYLNAAIRDNEKEYISENEKQAGLKLISEVLIAKDADRKAEVSLDLRAAKDHRNELNMDYEN